MALFKKEGNKKITLYDLEQKKDKTDLDLVKEEREKNLGLKTTKALKILRYFIYGSIIIILGAGVFQIVKSKQPRIIENRIVYDFAPSESQTAQTFALAFSKEFLTYSTDSGKDYYDRINPFIVNAVRDGIKVDISKGSSKVEDALVWKVEKINKEHSNITVRAEVTTTNNVDMVQETNVDGTVSTKPKTQRKIVYVSVPIGYYNGGYIVEDYPTFNEDPIKPADTDISTFSGNESLMDSEKEKIEEVLSNFFITYTTGNSGQISYYMLDSKDLKGLDSKYIFNGITSLQAYKDGKDVIAVVKIGMKDADLDTLFTQRYIFRLQKKDRWYIKDFIKRGNIYEEDK